MATQLKHTDFTYRPAPPPNIRVAFIAGEAAIAVNDAKLPDATLEELSIRSDTEALIAAAREHLSPRMFDAFLRWGEAAVGANIRGMEWDEAERLTGCSSAEAKRIGGTDAQNTDDLMFKTYLMALEAADCPATGPLRIDTAQRSDYVIEKVVEGIAADLPFFSPLCRSIDDWSNRAWTLSDSRSTFTPEIGAAMLEPFRRARAARLPAIPSGYSTYMRGPLIEWQKAYARYEEATAELTTFDREVYTPASRNWSSLCDRVAANGTDAALRAECDAASADLDLAQERFDALVDAQAGTIDGLLRLTAPGPSELAVKLQIFSQTYGWGICSDPTIGERMTTDARRFARHGAFLQTDEAILTAFADRRRVFEKQAPSDEDAYFAAIDAAESVMFKTNATTLEGVLAKLRVAFLHQVGENWSDLAASDTSQPAFRDGLKLSDVYTRLTWSAIEDLARIGGVTLSEQGR